MPNRNITLCIDFSVPSWITDDAFQHLADAVHGFANGASKGFSCDVRFSEILTEDEQEWADVEVENASENGVTMGPKWTEYVPTEDRHFKKSHEVDMEAACEFDRPADQFGGWCLTHTSFRNRQNAMVCYRKGSWPFKIVTAKTLAKIEKCEFGPSDTDGRGWCSTHHNLQRPDDHQHCYCGNDRNRVAR